MERVGDVHSDCTYWNQVVNLLPSRVRESCHHSFSVKLYPCADTVQSQDPREDHLQQVSNEDLKIGIERS